MRPADCILAGVLLMQAPIATASQQCAKCHNEQVKGYGQTGMGNSLGRAIAPHGGTVRHRRSSSRMEIRVSPAGMRHRLERDGLVADYEVDYFVGSGNKGRSYLVFLAGRLFQSPVSYYSDRKQWDLSPGFEADDELDFDRPVSDDCLFCHSGRSRQTPFTLNTYESPPFEHTAITCERCHGASEAHVAKPSAGNIVNPSTLRTDLRDAVCEQCHLGGEARILNPHRRFWDYRPGEPLENIFTTYVFERSASARNEPLKVVSHSEQLAASRCAQESEGRLWCGTCHDPHRKPEQPVTWYRERCMECHSKASLAKHAQPKDDCASCHMPRRNTYDGGHTAFTDHQILARPRRESPAPPSVPLRLRAWREPPERFAQRNLGLAHVSTGERYQSADHLNAGFRHLASVQSQFGDDAAVLTSLGAVLQRKRQPAEAAKLFARASSLEPRDARHRLNLGIALNDAGNHQQAVTALEDAIALDPSLRDAYLLLAEIHGRLEQKQKAQQVLGRYLELMPQSMSVRRAQRALR